MKTLFVLRTAKLDCWRAKLSGITAGAAAREWRVQVIETVPTPAKLKKLIAFWDPVGLVFECSTGSFSPSFLGKILQTMGTIPTVFIDQDPSAIRVSRGLSSRLFCVRHNPVAIAEIAAKELLALNFSSFAFVGWFVPHCWSEDKRLAFIKIIHLHGYTVHTFLPRPAEETNNVAFQKRLRDWLRTLPKPCGVFAVNDMLAENVIAAAAAEKIAVPDSLAVIGVDNDVALCERTHPTITSILPDFAKTGRKAVEIIESLCPPSGSGQNIPELSAVLPIGIVHRQSTRILRKKDRQVEASLELIRRQACQGLRAKEVFRLFPCSRRFAESRFKEATGSTVLKEIHRIRLEAACRLLENPGIPVKTIAERCGWHSDIIFRRIFVRAYGHLPRGGQK